MKLRIICGNCTCCFENLCCIFVLCMQCWFWYAVWLVYAVWYVYAVWLVHFLFPWSVGLVAGSLQIFITWVMLEWFEWVESGLLAFQEYTKVEITIRVRRRFNVHIHVCNLISIVRPVYNYTNSLWMDKLLYFLCSKVLHAISLCRTFWSSSLQSWHTPKCISREILWCISTETG